MTSRSVSAPPDVIEKSILHLHAAAYSLLPTSQPLSSHLTSHLLLTAAENDINLPQSYVDTRLCQRCGTIYIPGVTCTVRSDQSRRQKRKAKHLAWVVYECKICQCTFRTEVDVPQTLKRNQPSESSTTRGANRVIPTLPQGRAAKRKRERTEGLKSAIEKSKANKATTQLDLKDLMRVD
jgi:RNase P subunit RPR2